MRNKQIFSLVFLILVITGISACQADSYMDKEALINFSIPNDWNLKSDSFGMRFTKSKENDRSTILVFPKKRDINDTLARRKTISASQLKSQNGELITDIEYEKNGFSVWESEFKMGKINVYSFYLYSAEVQVEVKLMANSDQYNDHQSDLKKVIDSITLKRK